MLKAFISLLNLPRSSKDVPLALVQSAHQALSILELLVVPARADLLARWQHVTSLVGARHLT